MRAPGVDQEPEDFGQRDLEQNAVPSVPMDPTLCETLTFLVWAVVTAPLWALCLQFCPLQFTLLMNSKIIFFCSPVRFRSIY